MVLSSKEPQIVAVLNGGFWHPLGSTQPGLFNLFCQLVHLMKLKVKHFHIHIVLSFGKDKWNYDCDLVQLEDPIVSPNHI